MNHKRHSKRRNGEVKIGALKKETSDLQDQYLDPDHSNKFILIIDKGRTKEMQKKLNFFFEPYQSEWEALPK